MMIITDVEILVSDSMIAKQLALINVCNAEEDLPLAALHSIYIILVNKLQIR